MIFLNLFVLHFPFYIKRKNLVGLVGLVGLTLIINGLQVPIRRSVVGLNVGQKLPQFKLTELSDLQQTYIRPTPDLQIKNSVKTCLNHYIQRVISSIDIFALQDLHIFEFLAS
ncbi:hypothetical protein CYK00_08225 [Neisseria sicca]|uniref:Uncharacterized protein n=1 Tax=Neisseria sicca TaxID=490 RepID=A0A2I1XBC0_NEISI|nr:hypothetical protein CYK00_08225 [Neisseria sicca]